MNKQKILNQMLVVLSHDPVINNLRRQFINQSGNLKHDVSGGDLTIHTKTKNNLIWSDDNHLVSLQRNIDRKVNRIKSIYNDLDYITTEDDK